MNGGTSITERLNPTGSNVAPLPPVAVEQVPPVMPEAAPMKWSMEGDLFSDEAGRAESAPVAPKTAASIGNLATKSGEVNVDSAILAPNSPTQLPKRVDPYLRPSGPNTATPLTEEQRRAKRIQTDAYFGYTDHPNAIGTPRSPSVNAAPATRVPEARRTAASQAQVEADNVHFARLNGSA